MIAAETAPAHNPGDTALNHPAFGLWAQSRGKKLVPQQQDLSRMQLFDQGRLRLDRLLDDFKCPAQGGKDPLDEGSSISPVPPEVTQARETLLEGEEQGFGALGIAAASSRDQNSKEMALRINEQMPFAPVDFFSRHRSPFGDHERHWF